MNHEDRQAYRHSFPAAAAGKDNRPIFGREVRSISFEEQEDGTLRMELSWSDKKALFSWLLGFGEYVKIIEPVEYQEEFMTVLHKIMKNYEQHGF